jgi:hypothetical protein
MTLTPNPPERNVVLLSRPRSFLLAWPSRWLLPIPAHTRQMAPACARLIPPVAADSHGACLHACGNEHRHRRPLTLQRPTRCRHRRTKVAQASATFSVRGGAHAPRLRPFAHLVAARRGCRRPVASLGCHHPLLQSSSAASSQPIMSAGEGVSLLYASANDKETSQW